jgi:hypothetical protein
MADLRDKLIETTDNTKAPRAMAYFRQHLDDRAMLASLIKIALEVEDMGDAPWAAANVISEFPSDLLRAHESELRQIAAEPWDYLNRPAKAALLKLAGADPSESAKGRKRSLGCTCPGYCARGSSSA